MKQGEEKTKFVKEAENPTKKFIFQKNRKTKVAFFFIAFVLIILIAMVFTTDVFL